MSFRLTPIVASLLVFCHRFSLDFQMAFIQMARIFLEKRYELQFSFCVSCTFYFFIAEEIILQVH